MTKVLLDLLVLFAIIVVSVLIALVLFCTVIMIYGAIKHYKIKNRLKRGQKQKHNN